MLRSTTAAATLALCLLVCAPALATPVAERAGIPTPDVVILREPCPYVDPAGEIIPACADPETGTIYVPTRDTFTREHEIGHIFDAQYLDDGERNALKRAMGIPITRPWYVGSSLHDRLRSPNEKFADLFAACRLRLDPETRWAVAYDYQPTRRALRVACGVVRRAGRDRAPQA